MDKYISPDFYMYNLGKLDQRIFPLDIGAQGDTIQAPQHRGAGYTLSKD